jgi:broad specificity phosphatase PhoE
VLAALGDGYPVWTTFIRHGQPEHEAAVEAFKRGDHSCYTPEFRRRENRDIRLTAKGREQIWVTDDWLRANNPHARGYGTSPYLRCIESALELRLSELWFVNKLLRERWWGDIKIGLDPIERAKLIDEKARKEDPLNYRPGRTGESLSSLAETRAMKAMISYQGALLVTHSDFIRACLLFMFGPQFAYTLATSPDPKHHIDAAHVVQVSWTHPETCAVERGYLWHRSTCPWQNMAPGEWHKMPASSELMQHWDSIEIFNPDRELKKMILGRTMRKRLDHTPVLVR